MDLDNLIYLLFILMIAITLICILLFNFDCLEPCISFNAFMTLSVFFAVLNVERWGLYVGADTCIVVISGLLSFSIGSIFCKYCLFDYTEPVKLEGKDCLLAISDKNMWLISLIGIVFCYWSFQEIYNMSLSLGNKDGVLNMIGTVRFPLERHEISFSKFMNYRLIVAQVLAYISIYCFISNYILKKRIKIKYLMPFAIFIPFTIFTTGRMELLWVVSYIVTIFSIFYLKNERFTVEAKSRIAGYCLLAGVFFVLTFFLYGNFTGKIAGNDRTPLVIISHYAGLSVPALDNFLNSGIVDSEYIGRNTLSGIYSNLIALGFSLPETAVFLPFTYFSGIDTNVYTAFRRYIEDYGLVGMSCILFIFGVLFTYAYNYIKFKSNSHLPVILYATYTWTIMMSFHDEKFLMNIVNTQFIYRLGLFYLFLKILPIKDEETT